MSLPTLTPGIGTSVARNLHILYADDMDELRRMLALSLGRGGHSVETAADGRDALERIIATPQPFDLLITDHQMPKMTGLELVARLRARAFAGRIIVFSAALDEEVSRAYRQLRVDYILPKPIFPATLQALVGTLAPAGT